MRILLIEDEPEMASVLKTALERRDVVVDHVSTLADAEAMAKFGPFDAVVLDRRLPDGEGLSLIPRLRTLHVDAPVVVLTAMGSLDDRVTGLDAGADDYMVKPFATEELMARLRALLGSNALDAHISRLRRKLEDAATGIGIRAIRNLGYLLRAAP
jgi:two-component system, OmpR family, response regulator